MVNAVWMARKEQAEEESHIDSRVQFVFVCMMRGIQPPKEEMMRYMIYGVNNSISSHRIYQQNTHNDRQHAKK